MDEKYLVFHYSYLTNPWITEQIPPFTFKTEHLYSIESPMFKTVYNVNLQKPPVSSQGTWEAKC